MLQGKKILLGVTGSIAAYKSAFLVRQLVKSGAEVKVVMTPDATGFITPLTLSTLSNNPVHKDYIANAATGEWANHVKLGSWADLFIIAPCSANTLSKMANGACDNLLLAVYLSAKCPVVVAPAMDLDMYRHPTTKANLEKLGSFGNYIIQPGEGELASGLFGPGRLAEVEEIVGWASNFFEATQKLTGTRVVVSAGPTYEPIDPVRFIGNRSSGKMGFALASVALAMGAQVTLVTGPVKLSLVHPNLARVDVETASEMHQAIQKAAREANIIIMSAAVADFTPAKKATQKIKKDNTITSLELGPTTDILADLGKSKDITQLLIGFALETDNELENAKKKLQNKNLDMIVLNSLNDPGAGFDGVTNKVTIISKKGTKSYPLKTKEEVSKDIWDHILELRKD